MIENEVGRGRVGFHQFLAASAFLTTQWKEWKDWPLIYCTWLIFFLLTVSCSNLLLIKLGDLTVFCFFFLKMEKNSSQDINWKLKNHFCTFGYLLLNNLTIIEICEFFWSATLLMRKFWVNPVRVLFLVFVQLLP